MGVYSYLSSLKRCAVPAQTSLFKAFSFETIKPLCVLLWWVQLAWAMFYQFSPGFLARYVHLETEGIGLFMAGMSLVLVATSGFLLPYLAKRMAHTTLMQGALYLLVLSGLLGVVGWQLSLPLGWVWGLSGLCVAIGDVILFVLLLKELIRLSGKKGIEMTCLVFFSCLVLWMLCGLIGGYGFAKHPLFVWIWVVIHSAMALIWYHGHVES